MAGSDLGDDDFVERLFTLKDIKKMPNAWMVGANIRLHATMPAFNVVVRMRKTFFNSVVNTLHVMGKGWLTAVVSTLESTDVGVLKVVSDRLGFIRHRVSQMPK